MTAQLQTLSCVFSHYTDYKIITNPAVIPVGKNSTSVQLEIVNDTIIEGLEVVTLMMLGEELVGIDGDVSSNDERTAVYIQDNDGN